MPRAVPIKVEGVRPAPGVEAGRGGPGFGERGRNNRVPRTVHDLPRNDFEHIAMIGLVLRQFSVA
jgi:hypothetical protein